MATPATNGELKRQQALTAWLSSIAVKNAESNAGETNLSPEKIQALANQLSDMLIDPDEAGGVVSQDGQILNEDGDPIVEITEVVTSDSQPSSSSASAYASRILRPLVGLSTEERERRRRDREAWLDMLEAEEEEEWRSTRRGVEREQEPLKVNPNPGTPILKEPISQSQSPPASSLSELGKSTVSPSPSSQSRPSELSATHPSKKSVSFAEPETIERPSATDGEESWGNVIPARVKETTPPAFRVMRLDVVERTSSSATSFLSNIRRVVRKSGEDSDDEDGDLGGGQPVDNDTSEDEDSEEELEGEGEDFDEVMMQAEIAVEYYRRQGMLKEIAETLPRSKLASAQQLGDWDKQYVPLEANCVSTKAHKSSISRFKAERMLTDPVPSDPHLASAIRFGKLQDGQLIARDDEVSGDEDDLNKLDEQSLGIIERILQGDPALYEESGREVANVSATGLSDSGTPLAEGAIDPASSDVPSATTAKISRSKNQRASSAITPPTVTTFPMGTHVAERTTPFTAAASTGANTLPITVPGPTVNTSTSAQSPVSGVVERSAPWLSTPTSAPNPTPISVTRPTAPTSPTTRPPVDRVASKKSTSSLTTSTPVPVTITRSTLPATSHMPSRTTASPIPTPWSMDPPDAYYDPAGGFTSVILTPEQAVLPVSFPPPPENFANTSDTSFVVSQRKNPMSLSVLEATDNRRQGGQTGYRGGERISRFKAERM